MEALCIRPGEISVLAMDEREETNALEDQLSNSSTDEDDREPQPPPLVRRKVSFADAFGLDLVSVKEFDNVEASNAKSTVPSDMEEAICPEDFHMSCLFTVPATPEELEKKVQEQMLELESIELLPKTTTLRGIVRVLNLCYSKLVFVRITLDGWKSHFDLLAEYLPGSSDRKTDRFTFQYTLVPPFDKEVMRLDFCLRYETSVGTFWANNNQINYMLFCHHKVKDNGLQMQEESNSKIKKSCLKGNRRESAEEPLKEMLHAAAYATEPKSMCNTEVSHQSNRTEAQLSSEAEENKHSMCSVMTRHRAKRLAQAQQSCPQRRQRVPLGYSHSLSPQHQEGTQPISSALCNLSNFLHVNDEALSSKSAPTLSRSQIPLATLHWNNDKPWRSEADGVDKMWTEEANDTFLPQESGANDTAAVTSVWETLVNRTEEAIAKESEAFDAWQIFIKGSDCETQSGVAESERLQTPNNEDPLAQCEASRQVHMGPNTPSFKAASSNACHPLSDTAETPSANVALNSEDQEAVAALAHVRSPGDDKAGSQDAPQRSQTNSVTKPAREFSLVGAEPVSKGSFDSPSECREHEIWEQEGPGIIGGIGGDEPFTMHRADLVTSSGESQTADMTAMAESPNASAVDTISQRAGLQQHELSCGRDGKVTATAYNTPDDTLAFKETMRQGTADGERFVFSACRQGAEEGLTTKCAGNKVSKKEETVRPGEVEKCQVSQGGGEGEPQQDFSLEYDSLERCEQNETDALSWDGLCSGENSEDCVQNLCKEYHLEDQEALPSKNRVQDKNGHEAEIATGRTITQTLNEDELPHKNSDSQNTDARHNENTEIFPEINKSQTKPQPLGEKWNDKGEIQETNAAGIETDVTGDGVFQTEKDCCEIMQERQKPREEIPPLLVTKEEPFSTTERTLVADMIHQSDTSRSLPNPEVVEISWTHSCSVHRDDLGCRMSLEELVLKDKDTSAALQPETLEGMEEDISQRDKDERSKIGKLKIEAKMEEWVGNAENPGGENKNAPVKLKEQELSAEIESSSHVEYQKMSERTKSPISDDGAGALKQMGEKAMLLEGFGQELVRTVWQEVFDCQYSSTVQAPSTQAVGDSHREASHPVRSVITPNAKCKETLPVDYKAGQLLDERDEEIHFTANTNTSAHPRNGLNYQQRSVTSIAKDKEDSEVNCREGCYKTLEKHPDDSTRKLKDVPTWRRTLYVLFHITRLLMCVLLVAGFFLIFFFYDFTTFFVLYSFSMCCWIYKWRSYHFIRKEQDKEMANFNTYRTEKE